MAKSTEGTGSWLSLLESFFSLCRDSVGALVQVVDNREHPFGIDLDKSHNNSVILNLNKRRTGRALFVGPFGLFEIRVHILQTSFDDLVFSASQIRGDRR